MKLNDQNLENLILKILALKEAGKSDEEILALFPQEKEVLQDIFNTLNLLKQGKEGIKPPKALLRQILDKTSPVTDSEKDRYLYREGSKTTKISFWQKLIGISTMNKKVYLTLITLLIVAIGSIAYWQLSLKTEVSPLENQVVLEKASLNDDNKVLKELGEDTTFDTLEQDLSQVSEADTNVPLTNTAITNTTSPTNAATPTNTNGTVDLSAIEGIEDEFSQDLDSLALDLNNFDGLLNDNSLDNFESALALVTE